MTKVLLDEQDGHFVMRFLDSLFNVSNETEFTECIQHLLQPLLPHEHTNFGVAKIIDNKAYITNLGAHNLPATYFDGLKNRDGWIESAVVFSWAKFRRPIFYPQLLDEDRVDPVWMRNFRSHGLKSVALHGVMDLHGSYIGYYEFLNLHQSTARERHLMQLLVPHIHQTFQKVFPQTPVSPKCVPSLLSERQRDILRWIHMGKTSWEIARIMQLSDANTRYHIDRIIAVLNAKNRTQAVVKALEMQFI